MVLRAVVVVALAHLASKSRRRIFFFLPARSGSRARSPPSGCAAAPPVFGPFPKNVVARSVALPRFAPYKLVPCWKGAFKQSCKLSGSWRVLFTPGCYVLPNHGRSPHDALVDLTRSSRSWQQRDRQQAHLFQARSLMDRGCPITGGEFTQALKEI